MAEKLAEDKIVSDMLAHFKLSADAEADNRSRALFILNFTRPGAKQFDGDQIKARGSRPSYSFNQLPKFGRQVINDQWLNVPQIKYIPKNDASIDKAELLEDKIREVQAQGCAQTAYKMAIASQINIGWGYFAFATDYDNEESNDQNIYIRQIPNTFQVYDDPATREQDRSDRRYLIEIEDIPRTDFNRFNDREYSVSDLQSIGDQYPDWASMGKDLVRIGHYWRVEYDKSTVWFNKETGKKVTTKPKDIANYTEREIKKPRVMYYKCTAKEKLEDRRWEGSYIPYCFVEGNKNIVDGKTYYTGIYEDMVSTQVLYNYATNTAIELAESAPISPFIGDSRAFKGYEKFYDNVNTKNYSYLPFNAVDESGNPVVAPQRMQNGADLSSAVALIQMAEQNFYGTSGIYPASLGQQSNEKSGKAIIARQREGDVSTSNYADTFGRALLFGGKIFQDLSKKILDGAREIQVMSEDKKTRTVKINQKYTDEKTGKPMNFDLTKGDYEVAITTGPSFSTKREESREAQIELFQAAPQAMLPALPMIIRNMDWPNADKTADAVERGLPPELRDPERQEDQMKNIPPQVVAQMQQMQQVIEQMGQALQQAQSELESKQAENQVKMADVQSKQGDLQLKAQQQQLDAQDAQTQAQLDYERIQLEKQKLANDAEKNQIEKMKLQLEAAQLTMVAPQSPALEQPKVDLENPEAIQAHLASLEERKLMQEQQIAMQQEIDAQKMQDDLMFKQALLDGISQVANAFKESAIASQQQTAAILAPVSIQRDPVTGLSVGAVKVPTIIN